MDIPGCLIYMQGLVWSSFIQEYSPPIGTPFNNLIVTYRCILNIDLFKIGYAGLHSRVAHFGILQYLGFSSLSPIINSPPGRESWFSENMPYFCTKLAAVSSKVVWFSFCKRILIHLGLGYKHCTLNWILPTDFAFKLEFVWKRYRFGAESWLCSRERCSRSRTAPGLFPGIAVTRNLHHFLLVAK